jgi:CBS domain-containing membrane protein
LLDHPSILQEGVTLAHVGAAALSVALTGAVLLLLHSSHPPTSATTLIVSLGLLQTPREMVMLMVGVVLLTVAGWIINRALGVPMPVWSAEG